MHRHFDALSDAFIALDKGRSESKSEIGLMVKNWMKLMETMMTLTQFAKAYRGMPLRKDARCAGQKSVPWHIKSTTHMIEFANSVILADADALSTLDVKSLPHKTSKLSKSLIDPAGKFTMFDVQDLT